MRSRLVRCGLALAWASSLVLSWSPIARGPEILAPRASAPRVLANGRVIAQPAEGALYGWMQRREIDRVELAPSSSGDVTIAIEGRADTTSIDEVALLYVDHAPSLAIVPTDDGALYPIGESSPPIAATTTTTELRVTQTLVFDRPRSDRALLVLRARTTDFAEASFAGYLAKMGQGIDPFMAWVTKENCSDRCRQEVIDDELGRLAVRLDISMHDATNSTRAISPIGPEIARTFAVPIDLPPGEGSVAIDLGSTPGFWEVKDARLAAMPEREIEPKIAPLVNARAGSRDALALVSVSDRKRFDVARDESLSVAFALPAETPGLVRTTLLSYRGFHRAPVGGKRFVDPFTVLAHRLGATSLPRFAAAHPATPRATPASLTATREP